MSRSEPLFRPASLNDLDLLLEMVRDFHVMEHLACERETVSRIISELIGRPELGKLCVAETTEGRLAGYALLGYGYSIEYGGRDAFIDEIYLAPEYRKKGIGARFLKWVVAEAEKAGISVIHLEVDLENHRAFEVYKAFGFKPKSRRMMSLWLGQP